MAAWEVVVVAAAAVGAVAVAAVGAGAPFPPGAALVSPRVTMTRAELALALAREPEVREAVAVVAVGSQRGKPQVCCHGGVSPLCFIGCVVVAVVLLLPLP